MTPKPTIGYIPDPSKIFKAGIQCIRFPLLWESCEKNPEEFNQELDNISSAAGKYDILCIYDNHQWECSSYIGEGIGFPNSLLIGSCELHSDPSGRPSIQDLKFWMDGGIEK